MQEIEQQGKKQKTKVRPDWHQAYLNFQAELILGKKYFKYKVFD